MKKTRKGANIAANITAKYQQNECDNDAYNEVSKDIAEAKSHRSFSPVIM